MAPFSGAFRRQSCDACDEPITTSDVALECGAANRRTYLHNECLYIRYPERTAGA